MPAGPIRKLSASGTDPVAYALPIGGDELALAPLLGQTLRLSFTGGIRCIHCDRSTKKSFGQGYCFPCYRRLARCDGCIVRPELCHFANGTCREPAWAETHCRIPHFIYLANASALKVGITRAHQATTRWIDQGAVQALPVLRVETRLDSGLAEVAFKAHVSDRTDWRAMLRGEPDPVDLAAARDALFERVEASGGDLPGERLGAESPVRIRYPVLAYPRSPVSIDLEKTRRVEGTLIGIKGQYLLLDTGVVNVRKYAGYQLEIPD
ncbi:MAG: DUF2797 domain-containing protein [Deltaproteobacteria bacterium]|nr:DUF2797 domain-containing protein [Deltaproteobacteria bacterium]